MNAHCYLLYKYAYLIMNIDKKRLKKNLVGFSLFLSFEEE